MKEKHKVRETFRNSVFKRDSYRCVMCGRKSSSDKVLEELDAHHIVSRKLFSDGGYRLDNGITLCKIGNNCHLKAERNEVGFTVEDLRKKLLT